MLYEVITDAGRVPGAGDGFRADQRCGGDTETYGGKQAAAGRVRQRRGQATGEAEARNNFV